MIITPQAQMDWGDVQALMIFWGDHAFSHASYARAIGATGGKQVPVFDVADQAALADMSLQMTEEGAGQPAEQLAAWLTKHQSLHEAELAALALNATFDLADTDFSNPQQFATWMETHARLHSAQDARLGL